MSSSSSSSSRRKKASKRALHPVDKYVELLAPSTSRMRVAVEIPLADVFKIYRGTSAYGPCLFYHHEATGRWMVICRDTITRRRRFKPVLTDSAAEDPLMCPLIRGALGDPPVLPSRVSPFVQAREWLTATNMHIDTAQRNRQGKRTGFLTEHVERRWRKAAAVADNGDYMWAVWYPCPEVRQEIHEQFPSELYDLTMSFVGDEFELPATGFTGFYKPKLVLEEQGRYIRCARNTKFWARRADGPAHFWREPESGLLDFELLNGLESTQEIKADTDDDDDLCSLDLMAEEEEEPEEVQNTPAADELPSLTAAVALSDEDEFYSLCLCGEDPANCNCPDR